MKVAPGTLVVWSDIGCPWAHLAVHRLHEVRRRLGVEDRVRLDHRAFALELANERPTPKRILDAEVPVVGGTGPDAGWLMWQRPESEYPVTTLPALEAVQAAKEQGLEASERLDRALRLAFFAESRCISMRHVVLAVAAEAGLDTAPLATAIDEGRGRRAVLRQHAGAVDAGVKGSPHVFVPDGGEAHNPGLRMHWVGDHGRGFPVVESDDPSVYDDLVTRAAAAAA